MIFTYFHHVPHTASVILWETQVWAIWPFPSLPAGSGHLHGWKPKMSACSQWDCVLTATSGPISCLCWNVSLLLALPPNYCFVPSPGMDSNKEISPFRIWFAKATADPTVGCGMKVQNRFFSESRSDKAAPDLASQGRTNEAPQAPVRGAWAPGFMLRAHCLEILKNFISEFVLLYVKSDGSTAYVSGTHTQPSYQHPAYKGQVVLKGGCWAPTPLNYLLPLPGAPSSLSHLNLWPTQSSLPVQGRLGWPAHGNWTSLVWLPHHGLGRTFSLGAGGRGSLQMVGGLHMPRAKSQVPTRSALVEPLCLRKQELNKLKPAWQRETLQLKEKSFYFSASNGTFCYMLTFSFCNGLRKS